MNDLFEVTEEEKLFLDHLAYETVQHRPSFVYRWCRDHEVEPHEMAPLGEIRGYEYTLEPPKGLCPTPWKSASQFRERSRAAMDFLLATRKRTIPSPSKEIRPMTRSEREFYGLWMGEMSILYIGRASYLLARRGITYNDLLSMWRPYHTAWDAIGYDWCYHVPPLPLDLDLPCPWDSIEALASRVKELNVPL